MSRTEEPPPPPQASGCILCEVGYSADSVARSIYPPPLPPPPLPPFMAMQMRVFGVGSEGDTHRRTMATPPHTPPAPLVKPSITYWFCISFK